MADYYASDDAVTLTAVEADFLSGPWSSETPWKLNHDEGFEYELPVTKLADRASPSASPSGPACCNG
ncbi:MAG: hypothetical protein QOD83_3367 [Solirubrobacteraceae bacterium]|jgi:hypothetical protein|nr:hypothetical protein [Solirubrobacteraceae bacterium]